MQETTCVSYFMTYFRRLSHCVWRYNCP